MLDPSIFKVRILALPSLALNRPEPIIDESVSEEDVEASYKPYFESGKKNFKQILDIIGVNSKTDIWISANFAECHFLKSCHEVTDNIIDEKITNIFFNEENGLLLGQITYENLFDIVYGRFGIEFHSVYDTWEEYQEKTVSPDIFIHFIDKRLSLTVRDVRAGVLVSYDNDISVLKKILKDTEDMNRKLINYNFFKEMVMGIFELSEEKYKQIYEKNKEESGDETDDDGEEESGDETDDDESGDDDEELGREASTDEESIDKESIR